MRERRNLSAEEKKEIIYLYQNNVVVREIAEKFDLNPATVFRLLQKHDVVRINPFDSLNTQELIAKKIKELEEFLKINFEKIFLKLRLIEEGLEKDKNK